MEKEVWRSVKDYEDYQISNLGNVKSLKCGNERILKKSLNNHGYYRIGLHKNKVSKTLKVHKLVAIAFLNHKPDGHKLVVNHIDFNKLNNNVSNLEIVSQRENTNRKHLKSSSKYTGVYWFKKSNKWMAGIRINGKQKYLGLFKDEIEASNAYQTALKDHKNDVDFNNKSNLF